MSAVAFDPAEGRTAWLDDERWRPVPGFRDLYEVSDLGRVRSLTCPTRWGRAKWKTPKIMFQATNRDGYQIVTLKPVDAPCVRFRVARLVLEAFAGRCPVGQQAAHLNGRRDDNRLANLAWVSPKENIAHQLIHGTRMCGERSPHAKLTAADVLRIRALCAAGESQCEIAREYGIASCTVSAINRRRNGRRL